MILVLRLRIVCVHLCPSYSANHILDISVSPTLWGFGEGSFPFQYDNTPSTKRDNKDTSELYEEGLDWPAQSCQGSTPSITLGMNRNLDCEPDLDIKHQLANFVAEWEFSHTIGIDSRATALLIDLKKDVSPLSQNKAVLHNPSGYTVTWATETLAPQTYPLQPGPKICLPKSVFPAEYRLYRSIFTPNVF